MNNDYLRVNSKTEDKDIATSEFKNEKVDKKHEETKKLTLFTLLNFSRSQDSLDGIKVENMPNVKNLFAILILHFFATSMLAFISFLTSDVTVLMFTATIASLIFPLFIVLFFYNFNVSKNVSIIEVITGMVLGISLYVFLNLLEVYTNQLINFEWMKKIVNVLLRDSILFIGANLFIKIAKKDNLFDAILLAVTLYAGYMFVNSLDILINSLFIQVEIVTQNATFPTGAIVLSDDSFKTVILSFLKSIVTDVFYTSLLVSCYAIVNGGVIGLNVSPLKDKNYKEWSLYVLFFITVVLHLGAIFPSTIFIFEIILKTLSIVFSITLAIMILNYYLSKIHFRKED